MSEPESESESSSELTIYFADIGGSTALYERLGNEQASALIITALEDMSTIVRESGGEVLRTIGDEVLAVFPEPSLAIASARDTQKHFDLRHRLSVRIGFHHGEAIAESGDVYGAAVNLAARLTSLANIGEVLTTDTTASQLPTPDEDNAYLLEKWTSLDLKGINDQVRIRRIRWFQTDEDTGTQIVNTERPITATLTAIPVLTLRYGQQRLRHIEGKISVGRSPSCNLFINEDMVSRRHGTIEFKNGKFYFNDESSNGTWLCKEGDEAVRFLREAFVLVGQGTLGLGKRPNVSDSTAAGASTQPHGISYELSEELTSPALADGLKSGSGTPGSTIQASLLKL